jgi:hypothetical protein
MTEPIKILSPTGCVHIANQENIAVSGSREYSTLCNYNDSRYSYGDGFWHIWPKTDKQVSCRRCLSMSEAPSHRLKELTIKASDLETDFDRLAKNCEHFRLESKENAQIFHSLPLKWCRHRRRLGTDKYPKSCNILDCPLKYER